MRTVEQTADELVEKFYSVKDAAGFIRITMLESIQCAIIAVDEILNVVHTLKSEQYWMAVKKELEKRLK